MAYGTLTAPPRSYRRKRSVFSSSLPSFHLTFARYQAFVCGTCGRRFGVASNLNRHVKRCILKPVNRTKQPNDSPPADPTPSSETLTSTAGDQVPSTSTSTDSPPTAPRSRKRTREPDMPESPPQHTTSNNTDSAARPPAKRRRRAPSPTQWIPQSLLHFTLPSAEYSKPTSVPLAPVRAVRDALSDDWLEERDSWDLNVDVRPYHPCGWNGTLPGPGLGIGNSLSGGGVGTGTSVGVGIGGQDAVDVAGPSGLANGGTYVMGRLVMV